MSKETSYEKDIQSIRNLMERSSKFLSLSGLSGVLAGVYAVAGSAAAYYVLYQPDTPFDYHDTTSKAINISIKLIIIALLVLSASLITGYFFAMRKSKKIGTPFWSDTTRRLIINLAVPLVAGGIFVILMLSKGYYGAAAPATLIFYGLALVNASLNLFDEIRYLGYIEIVLGLFAAAFVGYGLYFWAFGFGVLHIVYGLVMYKKYDS